MSSALRVSRYALYTYDWPSRTPRNRRGRSRPILGSATLTTVESRKTIPDPSTAAARIQRLVLMRCLLCSASAIGRRAAPQASSSEHREEDQQRQRVRQERRQRQRAVVRQTGDRGALDRDRAGV